MNDASTFTATFASGTATVAQAFLQPDGAVGFEMSGDADPLQLIAYVFSDANAMQFEDGQPLSTLEGTADTIANCFGFLQPQSDTSAAMLANGTTDPPTPFTGFTINSVPEPTSNWITFEDNDGPLPVATQALSGDNNGAIAWTFTRAINPNDGSAPRWTIHNPAGVIFANGKTLGPPYSGQAQVG